MLTVHCDQRITRRKVYHLIQDEAGEIIFRHRLWTAVVEYLDEVGAGDYILQTDDAKYFCRLRRPQVEKETP